MKSLIQYIQEVNIRSLPKSYKIGLNVFEENTREALELRTFIEKFCNQMKHGSTVSLYNQTQTKKAFNKFFKEVCTWPISEREPRLKQYNLGTQNQFRGFFLSNIEYLKEKNYPIDWIYQCNIRILGEEYKKYLNSKDYIEPINGKDISKEKINPRYIIVYSRYEPDNFAVFPIEAKKGNKMEHLINMFKMDYNKKINKDIPYFECYPILAENYIGHEKELKDRAESQLGYDSPNTYIE